MSDIEAQIKCVERELKYRERVYGRLVEAKKITPTGAAKEIRLMRDVLATLREVEAERDRKLF